MKNDISAIFLDFDGVLNNESFLRKLRGRRITYSSKNELAIMQEQICDKNISCLKQALDQLPSVKIVISSAWRLGYSLDNLKALLNLNQIQNEVIGVTPSSGKSSSMRGEEVKEYLNLNPRIKKFLVIDDNAVFDIGDSYMKFFLKTSPFTGLTIEDTKTITDFFKESK